MKIRLHTLLAGPAGVRQPGIYEIPDDEAAPLIDAGYASVVQEEDEPKENKEKPASGVENAVKPPPENTAAKPAKPRPAPPKKPAAPATVSAPAANEPK